MHAAGMQPHLPTTLMVKWQSSHIGCISCRPAGSERWPAAAGLRGLRHRQGPLAHDRLALPDERPDSGAAQALAALDGGTGAVGAAQAHAAAGGPRPQDGDCGGEGWRAGVGGGQLPWRQHIGIGRSMCGGGRPLGQPLPLALARVQAQVLTWRLLRRRQRGRGRGRGRGRRRGFGWLPRHVWRLGHFPWLLSHFLWQLGHFEERRRRRRRGHPGRGRRRWKPGRGRLG